MSTNLNVICEFKTTAQEAEAKKMVWLEKLRAIEPNHMPIAVQDKKPQELHNWELDEIFEDQEVLVWFTDNSMYNVLVYENALLIWSFYRFYTLYRDMGFMEERRKEIKEITAIFGVTKGIYASDSGGFHPSSYFSARIEEWGDSYQSVIEHAKKENIPLIKYPAILPYEEFNNDSIQEVVWDDFLPLQDEELRESEWEKETKGKSIKTILTEMGDPLTLMHNNLVAAENKLESYELAQYGEKSLIESSFYNYRSEGGYHILAAVYAWNEDWEKAKKSHDQFLGSAAWREENSHHTEEYIYLVLAKDNREFIAQLRADYPYLEEDYVHLLKAYEDFFIQDQKTYQDYYYPYQIMLDKARKLYK